MGLGDGTFLAPTFLAGPALSTSNGQTVYHRTATAAIGDFNGDGRPDIAVLVQEYTEDSSGNFAGFLPSGSLEIFIGIGNGSFQLRQTITLTGQPMALLSGVFAGGTLTDLAVLLQNPNEVLLLTGDGHGDFTAQARVFLAGTIAPATMIAADFNNDGISDLAVADPQANNVTILVGTAGGNFQALAPIGVGTTPIALVTADFNGDPFPDLAVLDQGSADVAVLLSQTARGDNGSA